MSTKFLTPAGSAVFLVTVLAWLNGGVQPYYKTRYQLAKIDPITEIEYTEWVDAFLPGGETLLVGTLVLAASVFVASIFERRS